MSQTYFTRSAQINLPVAYTEITFDSTFYPTLEDEECFGLCMEKWENDFPEELCISNVIYVVLMVLRTVNTNEGKKEFSAVVKVGYTGNKTKGTLFNRLKEQFRENNAVDIIPLMIMQSKKSTDIETIEKKFTRF